MTLTDKQKQVYDFILKYQIDQGSPPTQREIKEHFEFKSFGSVQRYLTQLEEAGLLEKDWNARRGIKLIDTPKDVALPGMIQVPLLGKIAAGAPLLAEENWDQSLTLPVEMFPKSGDFFALKVKGDSMIEAGINSGDIAILRQQNQVEQGKIAAVMIEGEATLKRFYQSKKGIELHPENSRLSPLIIAHEDRGQVDVLGLLVGLWRWYK